MHKCNNCEKDFLKERGMELSHNGVVIAHLCNECLTGVNVGKIVFKKSGDTFEYEGYLPVEST